MKNWFAPLIVLLFVALCASMGLAAEGGDGAALYAKCVGCHGADGTKAAAGTGKPLKGMKAPDIEKALQGYKDGTYGGEKKGMMTRFVSDLSPADMKALAEYIAKF